MGDVERPGDAGSDVDTGDEEIVGGGELAQHIMKSGITRNEMLAAITSRLHAEALASLPPNVRKRVRGLRSLQKEFVDIEAKFYSEVHALECKYEKLYKPLFEKKLTAPSSEVRVSITPPLLASLPPVVRKRVRGLRSLQKEFVDIEAKFYSEVHALECKYEKLYKPLFEKKLTAPSSEVRVSITPPLLASLPPVVRKRVRGLRSLQKEFVDIEAKFYSEVHALECKYEKLYKPLFEKKLTAPSSEVRVSITPPLLASLPPVVRKRVRGLRSLQKEFVDIEAKFYSEVHALECKYEKLYKPLFDKVTVAQLSARCSRSFFCVT
ncbi:nucleosome assembly protein (NAP) domain-containing protein [Phthorimaea operculella]|nr:nucleosome assembly protein (NAP) domain-containing protein [Phthorimaea operculella]